MNWGSQIRIFVLIVMRLNVLKKMESYFNIMCVIVANILYPL